jgi:L-fuculose-phosphate aldolase
MANHGVVTYAGDLLHAYMKMEAVEHYAKIVLATRQLGCRKTLGANDLGKLLDAREKYMRNGN